MKTSERLEEVKLLDHYLSNVEEWIPMASISGDLVSEVIEISKIPEIFDIDEDTGEISLWASYWEIKPLSEMLSPETIERYEDLGIDLNKKYDDALWCARDNRKISEINEYEAVLILELEDGEYHFLLWDY